MPVLTARTAYLAWIREGRKTTTIRAHCRAHIGDRLTFTNYRESVRTRVTSVRQLRIADLTEMDARADGFSSRDALLQALRAHYALSSTARVWIIAFARVDADHSDRASAGSAHAGPI